MQRLFIEKWCNAFFSEVNPSGWGLAAGITKLYKKQAGGLWVGGKFTANGEWFVFEPNALNVMSHQNAETVQIHISEVRNIHRESRFLTDIVVIEHLRGEFKFRCFGAGEVANTLLSYLQYVQSFNNLYPTR